MLLLFNSMYGWNYLCPLFGLAVLLSFFFWWVGFHLKTCILSCCISYLIVLLDFIGLYFPSIGIMSCEGLQKVISKCPNWLSLHAHKLTKRILHSILKALSENHPWEVWFSICMTSNHCIINNIYVGLGWVSNHGRMRSGVSSDHLGCCAKPHLYFTCICNISFRQ